MEPLLQAEGLSKSYFGYPALTDVSLTLVPGEVHALVGENGAGKSTFMKLLAGVVRPDAGQIRIQGEPATFAHPMAAYAAGVATVFQELNLLPDRTVAQNIYLGREPRRLGLVHRAAMNRRAAELLASIGVSGFDPGAQVSALSVAQKQIVEIVKALSHEPRVISMDEPTAALADHEVELLYAIVRHLTAQGVAVLYVSHRMREIFDLSDRITVLRDGHRVATVDTASTSGPELVRMMVGRSVSTIFPEPQGLPGEEIVLSVEAAGNDVLDSCALRVRRGEILGVAGLEGSGRTELLEALAGVHPFTRGDMTVGGEAFLPHTPAEAIDAGIAFITEDRKATGLALRRSVQENGMAVVRARLPRRRWEPELNSLLLRLGLVARGPEQPVEFLSGGNQQKVVLAKWLLTRPRIILLDEPTRGIDVGAKRATYELMRTLAAEGHALVLVSSDLPEVIGMSDRILVMADGQTRSQLGPGATEEDVMHAATGVEVPA